MALRRTACFLSWVCASPAFVSGEARPEAPLTLLPSSTKGRCMDGSPGGYYHHKSTTDSTSRSWIITLQGGFECATRAQCAKRQGTHLESSKYFPKTATATFLGEDVERNPRLRTWNRVDVAYCSQDLWTGQITEPSEETWGYYFSGHFVLEGVLESLEGVGLKEATDIVLSGDSAGGIGVWHHLDWLAERYPNARVVGAPIAGYYFFAHFYTGPGSRAPPGESLTTDFREQAWPAHFKLWDAFVDQSCAAAIEPWRCILANNSFPYISGDVFITESGVDKIVTAAHDYVPLSHWTEPVYNFFKEWHQNMTVALAPSMAASSRNGVFSPACFTHTGFRSTHPLMADKSYQQVFDDWYHNGASAATKLQDSCGIFCNPSCPLTTEVAYRIIV
eukprot:TRINITY_DN91284_c0_g1_i1.p1 TRINITY_DN91284_c0_g1~~TRINITY_DN91284_c0_g1_i1.p1  ORF type:complete len:391 (-),score=33.35 TRINITY_DN91284_c0_g1_i1:512-1684(-)